MESEHNMLLVCNLPQSQDMSTQTDANKSRVVLDDLPNLDSLEMSQTQEIVTKINILLQEIHDIKLQKYKNNIFNIHKIHPKDTDEENAQDDTHLIYNSASSHPPLDKPNILEHHAPNPNHAPSIDDSAFAQQKLNPYELWSISPPELLSSSSSDEDLMDDNVDYAG